MRRSLTCLAAAPPLPTFLQLGVAPFWADRLHAAGLVQPTATQALALPPLLAGRSIVLRAETGTGKTLAYLLPILEALRARLASHDPAAQLLPVGLVVAPSIELVTQVCGVARALYPEYANMVLACHGAVGAVRRRNAGLLVATPLAAVEAINPVHLGALRYLVLDEADALLCGALRASMRSSLLPRMKQMMPNARPAHVFCAATIPDKGRDSAHAFLDKWYPAPDTQRIVTQGSHAPPPSVLQTFWQVDATLPLSRLELESQQRAAEAAAALASRESLLGQAGEEGRPGAGEAGEAGGGEGQQLLEQGQEEATPARRPAVDTVARAMVARKAEDEYLQRRVEEERRAAKVFSVLQLAVFEALLLPAQRLGLLAEGVAVLAGGEGSAGGNAAAAAAAAAAGAAAAAAGAAAPLPASCTLQDLEDGMAPSRQKARAKRSAAKREARAFLTIDSLQALPATSIHCDPGAAGGPQAWLHAYTPPVDHVPAPLTPATSALVPPTLVFVNSTAAASRLRAALAPRCAPHFTVAELTGELEAAVRQRRLVDFEAGSVRVLVCTNMAARGLDFKGAAHVIQAEFALDAEGHLHRMGRTGRAGQRGMVTSMVQRASLPLAAALVKQEGGFFSSKQSFTRARKRREIVDAALQLALAAQGVEQAPPAPP